MDYIANIRVKSGYPIQSFGGLNFFFSDPLFASLAKSLDSVLGARERQGVITVTRTSWVHLCTASFAGDLALRT